MIDSIAQAVLVEQKEDILKLENPVDINIDQKEGLNETTEVII